MGRNLAQLFANLAQLPDEEVSVRMDSRFRVPSSPLISSFPRFRHPEHTQAMDSGTSIPVYLNHEHVTPFALKPVTPCTPRSALSTLTTPPPLSLPSSPA